MKGREKGIGRRGKRRRGRDKRGGNTENEKRDSGEIKE
jgi:hypothetical protein